MKLDNANKKAVSKILGLLKENQGNVSSILDDIVQHLKDSGVPHTTADALRWADIMLGKSSSIQGITLENEASNQSISLKSVQPISNVGLKHYFKRCKIPLNTIEKYANQAWVFNHKSQKSFVALTFKNESSGDEIVNQYFSGTNAKQDITFIRGKIYKPNGLHIFKSILDFFALLAYKNVSTLEEDSIILNHWDNLPKATPYIKGYGYKYICCWLENTQTGIAASISISNFIKTEIGTRFINMVNFYKEHVSLYNWHLNYSDDPSP